MTHTSPGRPVRRGRGWWWVAAAALGVLIVCVGVIVAGAMNDGDGSPLVENPGAVLVGFFALVSGLGSALIGKLSGPLSDIGDVKENVQNDHTKPDGTPLNLRDDLDEKHDTVLEAFAVFQAEMKAEFAAVRLDIGGLRKENRDDRDDANGRISDLASRVRHIEQKGTP
ncbi:hypothetical protein ACTJI8_12745 [Microbacterium sp. 22303]|uniref:hypothetical protein n=1 Tax=Microbacterium sp. 22303 TaxID=3453905 RepID=UPI003F84ED5F